MTGNRNQANAGIGTWAKRCYFAGRAAMEAALRPYGLGASQWYVLHQLASEGPTMQRELLRRLDVERATLSVIVKALVGRGLVEQAADTADLRRKSLRLTSRGAALWETLPDLTFIHEAAFAGLDRTDVEAAVRVLRLATERLDALLKEMAA